MGSWRFRSIRSCNFGVPGRAKTKTCQTWQVAVSRMNMDELMAIGGWKSQRSNCHIKPEESDSFNWLTKINWLIDYQLIKTIVNENNKLIHFWSIEKTQFLSISACVFFHVCLHRMMKPPRFYIYSTMAFCFVVLHVGLGTLMLRLLWLTHDPPNSNLNCPTSSGKLA